jgi:3-oxoacyl-[acyl-carrier-protein] synthase II
MPAKETRRRDRYQQYVNVAAQEAIRESGLHIGDEQTAMRTGVIIGSAVGGVESYYDQQNLLFTTNDPRRITPFGIPMLIVNGGSGMVSIDIGAMGPSYTPISACATGADCIGHAFDLIRLGRLDQALAAVAKRRLSPLVIAAFDRIGAVFAQE